MDKGNLHDATMPDRCNSVLTLLITLDRGPSVVSPDRGGHDYARWVFFYYISRLVSHIFRFYDGLCDDLLGFRLPLANKILELLYASHTLLIKTYAIYPLCISLPNAYLAGLI